MKSKILITGAAGFLGYHLVKLLRDKFEIGIVCHRKSIPDSSSRIYNIDALDYGSITPVIDEFEPDLVVNCAAAADVDWCRENRDRAFRLNETGALNMARACLRSGCRLIHISTDMVFDGAKGDYTESDPPNPGTVYGQSKLAGEEAVLNESSDFLIFRVATLYGPSSPFKKGYVCGTIEKLNRGEKVMFFTDQIRTPLYTGDVAQAIELSISQDAGGGIYHLCGDEKVTRMEFGMKMQEEYGFDAKLMVPAVMADLPRHTRRPRDVSLKNDKARDKFAFSPTLIKDALNMIRTGY
jgi:dTDP-4-dehydrorhamnose reductase